jgi:hypothetical protein
MLTFHMPIYFRGGINKFGCGSNFENTEDTFSVLGSLSIANDGRDSRQFLSTIKEELSNIKGLRIGAGNQLYISENLNRKALTAIKAKIDEAKVECCKKAESLASDDKELAKDDSVEAPEIKEGFEQTFADIKLAIDAVIAHRKTAAPPRPGCFR